MRQNDGYVQKQETSMLVLNLSSYYAISRHDEPSITTNSFNDELR